MTPFDPTALLVMLLTFYPDVSAAALARARRERPDYFAGGEIIGRTGSHLRLPDGSEWDLIFAVDGPEPSRWQVIAAGGGGEIDDGLAYEAGPLTPIDLEQFPRPVPRREFEDLLARHAGALAHVDDVVALAEGVIVGAATPDGLAATYEATVGAAGREVDGQLESLHTIDPSDLLILTDGHGAVIDAEERDIPPPDGAPGEIGHVDPGEIPTETPPPPPEV